MQAEHNGTILVFRIPNMLDAKDIEASKQILEKQLESGLVVHDNRFELVAVISKGDTHVQFKEKDAASAYYPPIVQRDDTGKWLLPLILSIAAIAINIISRIV